MATVTQNARVAKPDARHAAHTPEPEPRVPTAAEIFSALAEHFDPSEERQREGSYGRQYTYVTLPTIKRRLDEVLGPENWEDAIDAVPGGIRCTLTVTLPDGRRVSRAGIGDGEDAKTAETDSFKRAARKFGVALYLYEDDGPPPAASRNGYGHGNGHGNGNGRSDVHHGHDQDHPHHADEPRVREHGYGSGERAGLKPPRRTVPDGNGGYATHDANGVPASVLNAPLPRNGRQLYRWAADRAEHGVKTGTLKAFSQFGDLKGWTNKLTDWDGEMVSLALNEMGLV